VLQWIIDRCEHRAGAQETALGYLPHPYDLDTIGLNISAKTLQTLTSIDLDQCRNEMISLGEYLEGYGDRTPDELLRQQHLVLQEIDREIAKA
jgi:phosphoenolpyruvate carboxykinase (GTP)